MADGKPNIVSDKAKGFTMDALRATVGAKPKGLNIPAIAQTTPKRKSPTKHKTPTVVVRRPERKRTGRNFKFNQTITPETAQAFYDMQAKLGIPMGAVLELAIEALKKEKK